MNQKEGSRQSECKPTHQPRKSGYHDMGVWITESRAPQEVRGGVSDSTVGPGTGGGTLFHE